MRLFEIFDNPGKTDGWAQTDARFQNRVAVQNFVINVKTGETKTWGDYLKDEKEAQDFEKLRSEWERIDISANLVEQGEGGWKTDDVVTLPEGTWEIHFTSSLDPRWSQLDQYQEDDKEDTKWAIGTGNSVKKFSTILNVIRTWMKRPEFKYVLIMAPKREPSRVRLYNRLVGNNATKKWESENFICWLIGK